MSTIRRHLSVGAGYVGICAASLVLYCSPALASKTHALLAFPPFGALSGPAGLDIDQSNGNLFVVNSRTNQVLAFDTAGGPPVGGAPSTLSGIPGTAFSFDLIEAPVGAVAVDNACAIEKLSGAACSSFDPAHGDIYVADVFNHVIDKFRLNTSHEYEYVCQFTGYTPAGGVECLKGVGQAEEFGDMLGLAVDRHGDVYMSGFGTAYEFNPAGEPITTFEVPLPKQLVVDPTGDVYALTFGGEVVELERSSLTGAVESTVTIASEATGLALDPVTGGVLVDFGTIVKEYNSLLEVESEFGSGTFTEGGDIAVNDANGDVYVADDASGKVFAFGPLVTFVAVTTEGSSNIEATSATLEGSIDPEATNVTSRFEYGLTTFYGESTPGAPAAVSGGSTVAITAGVAGLEPNAIYHYRLDATNSEGTTYGRDQTFTTPPAKPMVTALPPSLLGPHSASLNAIVNTNNNTTTYRFLYGLTGNYGASVPLREASLGSAYGNRHVAGTIEGLQPGSTYHYAIQATNAQGTSTSPDATFNTPPPTLPAVSTEAASEISQNNANITGTVNPQGLPTSYEFDIGTDTTYGSRIFGEAGSGDQATTITLTLHGLAPATLYHYRLQATNTYGTTYGADQTFTTSSYPTATIGAPIGASLIPAPAFTPPSTNGATTKSTKPKRRNRKKKTEKKHQNTYKASRHNRESGQ
jgi:hypothetical protein